MSNVLQAKKGRYSFAGVFLENKCVKMFLKFGSPGNVAEVDGKCLCLNICRRKSFFYETCFIVILSRTKNMSLKC